MDPDNWSLFLSPSHLAKSNKMQAKKPKSPTWRIDRTIRSISQMLSILQCNLTIDLGTCGLRRGFLHLEPVPRVAKDNWG